MPDDLPFLLTSLLSSSFFVLRSSSYTLCVLASLAQEVAWRRLATDALSQRTLSAPTNIAAVPTARDDIFSQWFDLNKIVGQLTTVKAAWNSLPTSKPSKKRLLAAHAATANDANTNVRSFYLMRKHILNAKLNIYV